jgi:colanic acid/amylovoran biosynthesis glycosyltransferase
MILSEITCNGFDISTLPYSSPENRAPLIVAAARLDANGTLRDLLEACRILVDRRCTFHCELFGDGSHLAQWRTLVEGIGLAKQIQFMGKPVPSQWRDSLGRAAVFAAVSGQGQNSNGVPLAEVTALHEAMSLGTPCLVMDDSPAADLIQDGETGFIEPRHHPIALAISLQRLLVNSSLRVRVAHDARCLIESRYDPHFSSARHTILSNA